MIVRRAAVLLEGFRTDMVHPNLMFDIGDFYSELDGIGLAASLVPGSTP